jgi:hypothetical protein
VRVEPVDGLCTPGATTPVTGQPEGAVRHQAPRPHRPGPGGVHRLWGDLLWCDGGWPGGCHEQDLVELSGLGEVLDAASVVSLLDRGFRGMAKPRAHWHAPVGDRRTKDRLTGEQRAFNRLQAGLRALVEQSIGHLANAWALRRRRGLLYRVRDVYRAAGVLVCLGRWLHRIPT